nr:phytochrome C [Tanacetum cinerariifolium]
MGIRNMYHTGKVTIVMVDELSSDRSITVKKSDMGGEQRRILRKNHSCQEKLTQIVDDADIQSIEECLHLTIEESKELLASKNGVADNVPANDPCTCDISSNGGIQELRVITDNL